MTESVILTEYDIAGTDAVRKRNLQSGVPVYEALAFKECLRRPFIRKERKWYYGQNS